MSLVLSSIAAAVALLLPLALWQAWVLGLDPLAVVLLLPRALVGMALGLGLFLAPTVAVMGLAALCVSRNRTPTLPS